MSAGEPEYLKHLTAEEIATVAHGAITAKNMQIENLQTRIRELEALHRIAEDDCQRAITRAEEAERDLRCLQESTVDVGAFNQVKAENARLREALSAILHDHAEAPVIAADALEPKP